MNINNSNSIDNFLNQAKYCFENDKLDEALSNCMKIIEIDPKHSNTYNNIGIIFQKKKMILKMLLLIMKKQLNIIQNIKKL